MSESGFHRAREPALQEDLLFKEIVRETCAMLRFAFVADLCKPLVGLCGASREIDSPKLQAITIARLLEELLQVMRETGLQFLEADWEQEQFVLQSGIHGCGGAIAPREEESALAGEHAVDLGKG